MIAFDDEIDTRYHRIEKLVEETLALETPVAGDLRLVLAVLHYSIHLERIGDQSVTIAKLTKLTADLETRHDLVEGLREMGDRCEEMVKSGARLVRRTVTSPAPDRSSSSTSSSTGRTGASPTRCSRWRPSRGFRSGGCA